MDPAEEDLFERLPDDLVLNILEKRLWCPFNLSTKKAKERVRLEAVCKRFQALVRRSGSLEWDHFDGQEIEILFLRYVLARRVNRRRLTRFALHVNLSVRLMTIQLLVIPLVVETLCEVHLIIDKSDVLMREWETVFHVLQTCSKLAVLDIKLMDCDP